MDKETWIFHKKTSFTNSIGNQSAIIVINPTNIDVNVIHQDGTTNVLTSVSPAHIMQAEAAMIYDYNKDHISNLIMTEKVSVIIDTNYNYIETPID